MHHLLKNSLELSKNIVESSNDINFEKILILSQERQKHLEAYFKLSPLPDTPETIQATVEKITHFDNLSKSKILENKKNMIAESISLNGVKKAICQYHNVQIG